MNRHWRVVVLAFVLMTGFTFVTCGDDDDDNDDPYRPYGEDLPACDPYDSDFAWFEIENFASKVMKFVARYGKQPQSCIASLDDGDLEVICDNWSLSLTWLKKTDGFPIQDGQQVNVAASTGLDDWFDIGGCSIVILSEEMDILLFQSDGMTYLASETGPWHAESHEEKVCEYFAGQAQPPSPLDDPFTQVVGLSFSGSLNGLEFSLPAPATAALTEDGEYWAILPIHYVGVFDWAEDTYDGGDDYEFLFQLVKK